MDAAIFMMEFGMRCLAIALLGLNKMTLFIPFNNRVLSNNGCLILIVLYA
jgi:hypothetical protein